MPAVLTRSAPSWHTASAKGVTRPRVDLVTVDNPVFTDLGGPLMSPARNVTRRLSQAILGAAAVGTLALTGHLALAHASATPPSAAPAQSPPDKLAPGASSGSNQPLPGQNQPSTGQNQPRGGSGSGFGQTPGLQGRSAGGGSTTTHGS